MKELPLNPTDDMLRAVTRRHFFRQAGFGIGSAALTTLLNRYAFAATRSGAPMTASTAAGASAVDAAEVASAAAAANPLAPKPPMFAPKAKSIIYLFMAGAPSQVDLLDYKPKLQQLDGQGIPAELTKGERFAFIQGTPKLLGSPYHFKRWGRSGADQVDGALDVRRG